MKDKNLQRKKLVIFDMDGVVLDSEPVHLHSKEKILENLGLSGCIDLSDFVGVANEKLWGQIIEENQLEQTIEEMVQMQDDLNFREIVEEKISLSTGIRELLEKMKEKKCTIAMASSSSRYFVHAILEHFEIKKYFSHIITGDDVIHKKPDPEIYRKVLEATGIPAEAAVVIEDSKMGTLAAKGAGISCIGYRNPTSGCQDLSQTVYVVDDLRDIFHYLENES